MRSTNAFLQESLLCHLIKNQTQPIKTEIGQYLGLS